MRGKRFGALFLWGPQTSRAAPTQRLARPSNDACNRDGIGERGPRTMDGSGAITGNAQMGSDVFGGPDGAAMVRSRRRRALSVVAPSG